jgi:hypothetical protein
VHRTQGQSVVDYLMGPASFLKFTTSVAHYIVDGDHVLMRMTIQGTWSSASQNQDDRELASGLTERQADCRHLSGPDKGPQPH